MQRKHGTTFKVRVREKQNALYCSIWTKKTETKAENSDLIVTTTQNLDTVNKGQSYRLHFPLQYSVAMTWRHGVSPPPGFVSSMTLHYPLTLSLFSCNLSAHSRTTRTTIQSEGPNIYCTRRSSCRLEAPSDVLLWNRKSVMRRPSRRGCGESFATASCRPFCSILSYKYDWCAHNYRCWWSPEG